jgi:hypothetical protein
MFESSEGLGRDIRGLLDAIREATGARYACVVEPSSILFESESPAGPAGWVLRHFLEPRLRALFTLPASLAGEGPGEDVFEGWDEDDFLLAFLNGRVALAVACANAEQARASCEKLFDILADRLLRFKASYRVDAAGRGLFLGQPRVDWVVAARDTRA